MHQFARRQQCGSRFDTTISGLSRDVGGLTMNAIYTHDAKQGSEEHTLLEQVTKELEAVAGPSGELVSAKWERSQDERGRPVYRLTLTDDTGEVSAPFTLKELQHPRDLRGKLLELWGDLLQVR